MNKYYKAWGAWSLAIFIVWGVIFLARWRLKGSPDLQALLYIFYGYFIGWLSATIKFALIVNKFH